MNHRSRPVSMSQAGQKPNPDVNTLGVYLWVDMCTFFLYESGVGEYLLRESVCVYVCRVTIDSSDIAVFP
jgi:hypothetical protein